jgi:hypothetical protein
MVIAWVRLQLDLDAFDDARFDRYLQSCRDSGIRFTTMAAVGDTAEHRRAPYDLNKTCSADIPERGELPETGRLAGDAGPGHRLRALCGYAPHAGLSSPDNVAAIGMNRRLGFVEERPPAVLG